VVKPFSHKKLSAGCGRFCAGCSSEFEAEKPLTYSDLSIDPQTRLVSLSGQEINLTSREFDLLWLLARHPRQVFNRQQLLERVWGGSNISTSCTVTAHLRRLRKNQPSLPASAANHRVGVGYKSEP
jgi:DNA-binding response OmpR family regulator